ncbi:MAG TPA: oligosaccharide flippase family protein [Candidatus Limnocylindrales bacterium]|nr:oligosaccharide flippase family protein [Candidatus Limnocylindrales bacterium]
MHKLLGALRTNDFLRNNLIFFVGSLAVSFLNYLYYPVLGRVLEPAAFGEVQVLISLFTQMTIFITVLSLISTNVVVNESDPQKTRHIVGELEKITLYVALGCLALITTASPLLKSALKFESIVPFIIIGLVLVVSVQLGFRGAYLRGKSDFIASSLQGILASLTKIIASILLVLAGFKTAGAIGGLLAAQIIALIYTGYRAKKLGYQKYPAKGKPEWAVLRPQAKYAGLVFTVSLVTTLLYSADVTIIKYLFSPEVAGQYAGMSTVARIVLFLTGSFAVVLLSSVKVGRPPQENSRLLVRSFIITLVLGGAAALVFVLFPVQVIHLLFGAKYDNFAHLLPLLSMAMLAVSLTNLIANYHIALRHYWVLVFVGLGAVVTAILLVLSHATPDAVVRGLVIGTVTMLLGLLGWTGYRAGFTLKG